MIVASRYISDDGCWIYKVKVYISSFDYTYEWAEGEIISKERYSKKSKFDDEEYNTYMESYIM